MVLGLKQAHGKITVLPHLWCNTISIEVLFIILLLAFVAFCSSVLQRFLSFSWNCNICFL